MATPTELLAAVDAAIIDILENGQEVILRGTTYNKANLETLTKMRDTLNAIVNRSTGGFFGTAKHIIPRRCP